jgi:type I restriction enzyme S subunit
VSWPEVDFESLFASPSRNGVYKSKEHHGSGVPIVNMGELFAFNRIGNQPMSLIRMSDAEMDKSNLVDGDLLFGRRSLVEEGAGKCSMVYQPTGPLTFESSIIRVRLDKSVADPEFFFNYFRSPIGRSRIRAIVGGAAVKGIRGSDLKLIKVHLPPLTDQIAIRQTVAVYDDLIATNQRRIQLLEESARLLYREWFVHLRFPGHELVPVKDGVPEGWRLLDLGTICDTVEAATVQTGPFGSQLHRHDYKESGVPVVMPQDIVGDRIRRDKIAYVDEQTANRLGRHRLQELDIVFPRRGDISKRALVEAHQEGFLCGTGCLKISLPSEPLHPLLLYFQLADPEMVKWIEGQAVGATMLNLSASILRTVECVVPTLDIQQQFVAFATMARRQIDVLEKQNDELMTARDLLLPKLMSGQLDVSRIPLPEEIIA